jgi:hypothetical protein
MMENSKLKTMAYAMPRGALNTIVTDLVERVGMEKRETGSPDDPDGHVVELFDGDHKILMAMISSVGNYLVSADPDRIDAAPDSDFDGIELLEDIPAPFSVVEDILTQTKKLPLPSGMEIVIAEELTGHPRKYHAAVRREGKEDDVLFQAIESWAQEGQYYLFAKPGMLSPKKEEGEP